MPNLMSCVLVLTIVLATKSRGYGSCVEGARGSRELRLEERASTSVRSRVCKHGWRIAIAVDEIRVRQLGRGVKRSGQFYFLGVPRVPRAR
jgi:hypothetical protein